MRGYLIVFLLLFSAFSLLAQEEGEKAKTVEFLRANTFEFDESTGISARRALGKVVFKHEDIYMFCDSAWFIPELNLIYAYDNVRIKQGDSILLVSKTLEYDGNSRLAKMRDSVVIKHNNSILITDSIDFDRNLDLITYFSLGKIYDNDNDIRLVSEMGYYYIAERNYLAVKNVVLRSSQYNIYSRDTLKYNTESAIANFYGPTNIVADSNLIYCENGFYDTRNDISAFSKNPFLRSKSNYLYGDSLFYDRKILYGEAFGNVKLIDTVENVKAMGEYAYYFENSQESLLTDNVLLEYLVDNDTVFLHSDSITTSVDSLGNKFIEAFRKVQIYKSDVQARCDSLSFNTLDSIIRLYYDPIIWAEKSQITADYIQMYFKDKEPYRADFEGNVFAVQSVDSLRFNQVRCENMLAFFENRKIKQIDLLRNSQSAYFFVDDQTKLVKYLHKLVCSKMKVDFEDDAVANIIAYDKPDGQVIPIDQVNEESSFLENFIWLDYLRPKSKEDVFIWKKKNLR